MGALLRMQLDNCMRTYAAFIAEDKIRVIDCVVKGDIKLKDLKSKTGKKLTDQYLSEQLNKIEPRFKAVYYEASGYIHHSNKSFYAMTQTEEPFTMKFGIGVPLPQDMDRVIIEGAQAFLYFLHFQYRLLEPVIRSKIALDKKLDGDYIIAEP